MIDTYREAVIPIIPCELRENDEWIRGTSHHLKVHYKNRYYRIYRFWSPEMQTFVCVDRMNDDGNYNFGCGSFLLERWILFKFRKQIKEYGL